MTLTRLIGSEPNQVSTNGMLGNLAFQNAESVDLDRVYIDELLIGTTTPATKLTVADPVTAHSFIPTSAIVPTNGLYLPAANTVGIATGSNERVRVDSAGNVGIGTTTNTHSARLVVGGTIAETISGTQYPVLSSFDIGTSPDKVPINSYLGQLAFLDEVSRWIPGASAPTNNLDINFEYVSDTSIKIRMKGSDGVVRSTTLTLS